MSRRKELLYELTLVLKKNNAELASLRHAVKQLSGDMHAVNRMITFLFGRARLFEKEPN